MSVAVPCAVGERLCGPSVTEIESRSAIHLHHPLYAGLPRRAGNPRAVVAPDVFVVIGAPTHIRRSYKLW